VSAMYALYDDGDAAQVAVDALRAGGVNDDEITVITSEPMEDYEFGSIDRRTRLWYVASAGGALGCLFAAWLTRFTEVAWPLPTGNMPIVAWWPNLIIVFELTMLGAILATVATLVITGGLARKMPALYDPAVSSGKILVGVAAPRDRATVERALVGAGSPVVVR
jgi:ActD protein